MIGYNMIGLQVIAGELLPKVAVPPIPPITVTKPQALAEHEGAIGGYLLETQFGPNPNAEINQTLYPSSGNWSGLELDDSYARKVEQRKRRAVASMVASGMMDEDDIWDSLRA